MIHQLLPLMLIKQLKNYQKTLRQRFDDFANEQENTMMNNFIFRILPVWKRWQ